MVILKKDLMVAILATFCLTAILFTAIPIRSAPGPGEYDPWIDTNDDGILNYEDLFSLASRYGTFGTPINKTDLLLKLQSRIDSLNASVIGLQSLIETLEGRVTTLEEDVAELDTRIDTLNVMVLDLVSRVEALEAPGSVTTEKIADDAVTNDKLAAGAIPHNVTYSNDLASTNQTGFVDMEDMSVKITLTRNSTLIIMFSAEAWFTETGTYYMYWRAMVDAKIAYPDDYYIRITNTEDAHTYSYTFYSPQVVAGTHTITIRWRVFQAATTAWVDERTLTVIALPT